MDKQQPTQNNSPKKTLPILAIVFAGISLLFFLIPFINYFFLPFALAAFILGTIHFFRNRKQKKKALSLTAFILASTAFVLMLFTTTFYSLTIVPQALNDAQKLNDRIDSLDTSLPSSPDVGNKGSDMDKWSLKEYDALTVDPTLSGIGDNYGSIVQKFGEPVYTEDVDISGVKETLAYWSDTSGTKLVVLGFSKTADGQLLLVEKVEKGLTQSNGL